MMPDHLHAILFVREKMEKPLGKVLLGVKQACNHAFREVMPGEFVAVAQQHAEQMDGNMQNKRMATCRITKGWQHAEQQKERRSFSLRRFY